VDPKGLCAKAAAGVLVLALDVLAHHYGARRIAEWIDRRYAAAA
jgi:hypothetical protein